MKKIVSHHLLPILLALFGGRGVQAQIDEQLTGTVIGTSKSFDNTTLQPSTTVNTCAMAFDGKLDTYFTSWEDSYTWAGLDLKKRHVITRIGWAPNKIQNGSEQTLLGVFEGANRADFMDALPLYIINEQTKAGQMAYADVDCTVGFRYVRYVGPADAHCAVAELAFYGHEGEGDSTHLYTLTNLPTVSIHTLEGKIPSNKDTLIVAQLTIIGPNGDSLLSEPGTIRERGNGSRMFPKRPYRIKFDKKQHVLDAPAKAKKWTLINNYGDKTLLRNSLAFELSRQLQMPYTPYCRSVDVLLNGEYKGNYQLCDQVQVHKQRVNIDEMTQQDNSGFLLTGGYLIEIDAYAEDEPSWFRSKKWNPVTIKSPDADDITPEQAAYIENFFNQMEQQQSQFLDFNTFLRHFLVGELAGNVDTYWSVFMYKPRGIDTLYTGPVWDFDLAFDNDTRVYPTNHHADYVYQYGGSRAGNMLKFVDNIVQDNASAQAQMLEIWDKARRNQLTEEHLTAFIDSLETVLQQSQKLNFMRWPIMNQRVNQNPRIWGSYTAEVQNVRHFLRERLVWIDKKLGYILPASITHTQSSTSPHSIDFTRPFTVYSLSGQNCGHSLQPLPDGIYLVRQGLLTKKVVLPHNW